MSFLENILAKKKLKESLTRLSKLESIELKSIRIKFTFNPDQRLNFFIMDLGNIKKQSSIYYILDFNDQKNSDKTIAELVEKRLKKAINSIAHEKKLSIDHMDIRFYLALDDKQELSKLSMYLFYQNEPASPLNIDNYL